MAERRRTYLIQDPYDDDAQQFIRTIFTDFGLRPLCFYTDVKSRFYGERLYPILQTGFVEASYDVRVDDLTSFAHDIGERYQIEGIVPYREDTIEIAARLCEELGLAWNDPATLSRFRDKAALKYHVTASDPAVRLPRFRLIRGVADVFAEPPPDRFVLKPNDGFGNVAIGIFDPSQRREVAEHIDRFCRDAWILEEFIGGTEYNVNGQVRPDGSIITYGIMEYRRTTANEYSTVYDAEVQVHSDEPVHAVLDGYARRLLRATGLRGCPFHLEAKVDEAGPCVVDLGARMASEGGGLQFSRMNPGQLDVFTLAAHDYLGRQPPDVATSGWAEDDQTTSVMVYGISYEEGHICSLEGVEAVEAMPEFVHWAIEPHIGDRIHRTTELHGAPYIAHLVHRGDADESDRLIEEVRGMVRWNGARSPARDLRVRATDVARRARRKARWLAARSWASVHR